MKKLYIKFTYDDFDLNFEDEGFANQIAMVFNTVDNPIRQAKYTIDITGTDKSGYNITIDGRQRGSNMKKEAAAYCLTSLFGEAFCMNVNEKVYMMHAASISIESMAISFLGTSGSGKTSLALLISQYGRYVGDEYAYVDIEKGCVWHEKHPFQLKERNQCLLRKFSGFPMLTIAGEPFGTAYYISQDVVNYLYSSQETSLKVKAFVFPQYDEHYRNTKIGPLPAEELPKAVLQSLMGVSVPSKNFRQFLQMVNRENIRLIKICFSDGEDAAAKLFQYLQEG